MTCEYFQITTILIIILITYTHIHMMVNIYFYHEKTINKRY